MTVVLTLRVHVRVRPRCGCVPPRPHHRPRRYPAAAGWRQEHTYPHYLAGHRLPVA
jgi:hypothetical protein